MVVKIRVYENYHYMNEDEAWNLRDDFTPEEALAKCRMMVDEDLAGFYKPGMSASELFGQYKNFGDDPVIFGPDAPEFSAWAYAEARAAEIAGTALQAQEQSD